MAETEQDLKRPLEKRSPKLNSFVLKCPDCGATSFSMVTTLPETEDANQDFEYGDVVCMTCREVMDGVIFELDYDMNDELDKHMDEDD